MKLEMHFGFHAELIISILMININHYFITTGKAEKLLCGLQTEMRQLGTARNIC